MFKFLLAFLAVYILSVSSASASSWLGWGDSKKTKAPIPGMSSPENREITGATPSTDATLVTLDSDDMEIISMDLKQRTEDLKALGDVIAMQKAESAARRKMSEFLVQEQNMKQSRKTVAMPPIASKTRIGPPQGAQTKPVIKPYVVPRAPVQDWQAISDAERAKNLPRGNITVKSPSVEKVP